MWDSSPIPCNWIITQIFLVFKLVSEPAIWGIIRLLEYGVPIEQNHRIKNEESQRVEKTHYRRSVGKTIYISQIKQLMQLVWLVCSCMVLSEKHFQVSNCKQNYSVCKVHSGKRTSIKKEVYLWKYIQMVTMQSQLLTKDLLHDIVCFQVDIW